MENLLRVGVITSTHGVRGEVKVFPTTDDMNRFKKLKTVILDTGKEHKTLNIESVKFFKNMVFITFDGIDTIEMAEKLNNFDAEIYEEDLPSLEDGEFYIKDILGMEVITDSGEYLGTIKDVFRTGSNDVYEVKRENKKSMYLPAIKDVILSIDTENNKMTVHIIDGLDEI